VQVPLELPPFAPAQVQDQEPEAEAVPDEQRLEVGGEPKYDPLDDPQTPSTFLLAVQDTVEPVFCPMQVQDQGPEPETEDDVPDEQRLAVGIVYTLVPSEVPHTPSTFLLAVQVGVVPPYTPAQVQDQGPEPE